MKRESEVGNIHRTPPGVVDMLQCLSAGLGTHVVGSDWPDDLRTGAGRTTALFWLGPGVKLSSCSAFARQRSDDDGNRTRLTLTTARSIRRPFVLATVLEASQGRKHRAERACLLALAQLTRPRDLLQCYCTSSYLGRREICSATSSSSAAVTESGCCDITVILAKALLRSPLLFSP